MNRKAMTKYILELFVGLLLLLIVVAWQQGWLADADEAISSIFQPPEVDARVSYLENKRVVNEGLGVKSSFGRGLKNIVNDSKGDCFRLIYPPSDDDLFEKESLYLELAQGGNNIQVNLYQHTEVQDSDDEDLDSVVALGMPELIPNSTLCVLREDVNVNEFYYYFEKLNDGDIVLDNSVGFTDYDFEKYFVEEEFIKIYDLDKALLKDGSEVEMGLTEEWLNGWIVFKFETKDSNQKKICLIPLMGDTVGGCNYVVGTTPAVDGFLDQDCIDDDDDEIILPLKNNIIRKCESSSKKWYGFDLNSKSK